MREHCEARKSQNAKCKLKLVYVDEGANRLRFNSKGILNFKHLLKDFKQRHFVEVIIEGDKCS